MNDTELAEVSVRKGKEDIVIDIVRKMDVLSMPVTLFQHKDEDFISLTDIARHRDLEHRGYIIQNWILNLNTIEFLSIWEQLNNPDFNSIEFDGIKALSD